MLEAAEADLALEAGFVHVKARQGIPGNWPPSSSTRTNGVSGFAMAASVLSRAARRTSSTQAAGPNEEVGRRVRIRLAPADSQSLSRIPLRRSKTPAFRAAVRGGLDGGIRETRQAFHCAPTGGNVSVGPYSSTAVPLMRSAAMP